MLLFRSRTSRPTPEDKILNADTGLSVRYFVALQAVVSLAGPHPSAPATPAWNTGDPVTFPNVDVALEELQK